MNAVSMLIFAGFIAILVTPFLLMMKRNSEDNHPNVVKWYSDHLEFEGETLYYKDAEFLAFNLTHSKCTTNLVWKTYDGYAYGVSLSGISIFRSHEAYKRWSSDSKAIAQELLREYQEIIENAYKYILPVLLESAISIIETAGKFDLGEAVFYKDGTVECGGKRYSATDLRARSWDCGVELLTTKESTLFGNDKVVAKASFFDINRCLIEPLLYYLQKRGSYRSIPGLNLGAMGGMSERNVYGC